MFPSQVRELAIREEDDDLTVNLVPVMTVLVIGCDPVRWAIVDRPNFEVGHVGEKRLLGCATASGYSSQPLMDSQPKAALILQ